MSFSIKNCIGSFADTLRNRWQVQPLQNTMLDLHEWFKGPYGVALLDAQKQTIEHELGGYFGYHLMQLSVLPEHKFYDSSRINHRFSFSPLANEHAENAQACADMESLPLPDECIDVCILHHTLDFAANPQQVLKEAARVTVPRGYIILMGFNPTSVSGCIKPFAHFAGKTPIWKRQSLRVRRLKDWLAFLDFSTLDVKYGAYSVPINNEKYLRNTRLIERSFAKTNLPLGGTYCIFARKDKVGLTPIKPAWDKASKGLMDVVPLPKRAINPGMRRHSADVLPMRRRTIAQKYFP